MVLGVSTDSWEEILFRTDRLKSGLILLADPTREIIDSWGLEDVCLGKDIARPASYIIGPDGHIAWRHLPTDWRIRMGEDEYLEAFRSIRFSGASP